MPDSPARRPGDLLLDRYLPDADEETRERAREAFRIYAMHLISIGERLQDKRRVQKLSTLPSNKNKRDNI